MADVVLDGRALTPAEVEAVAVGLAPVRLSDASRSLMQASADWYARHGDAHILRSKWQWLVGGQPPVHDEDVVRCFVESHCAGVGDALPEPEVRALLLTRANALAAGWSGVRPQLVERLLEALNRRWTPVVPGQGSVGAAGCVSLAHAARVLLGLGGEVVVDGRLAPATDVVPALDATEKEALSLLNGSSFATALAALAVARARRLLSAAEGACALSMEVVRADLRALAARPAESRGHPGIAASTRRLRELLTGSELVAEGRKPDSFSFRCAPTVLGAARDALDHVHEVVSRELNGATDNPLVFPGHGVVEGGHFHGAPVGLAMDHLKIALVQVASISERRVFRLTYGQLSGLPSFLVPSSGVDSGLMLAQYTAASLVSEAKLLAMPGSVDSVPTVQHQEDHVSMAPIAARSALEVIDRVADVVAIELLCAAQGLDLRRDEDSGLRPGVGTAALHEQVRARVERWIDDRILHPDLAALGAAVRQGVFSA